MISEKTDTVLRLEGMNVLTDHLGAVDAERFIALMNREPFDYTRWRQDNLEDDDVRSLSRKAMQYRRDRRSKAAVVQNQKAEMAYEGVL